MQSVCGSGDSCKLFFGMIVAVDNAVDNVWALRRALLHTAHSRLSVSNWENSYIWK